MKVYLCNYITIVLSTGSSQGTAHVEIEGTSSLLNVNESIFVPLRAKHRLSNFSDTLIIIEIQNGSYLGEDDIERFEDKYGRDLNL